MRESVGKKVITSDLSRSSAPAPLLALAPRYTHDGNRRLLASLRRRVESTVRAPRSGRSHRKAAAGGGGDGFDG